jgi:hypothetical protein
MYRERFRFHRFSARVKAASFPCQPAHISAVKYFISSDADFTGCEVHGKKFVAIPRVLDIYVSLPIPERPRETLSRIPAERGFGVKQGPAGACTAPES